jgi:hypothetical protein
MTDTYHRHRSPTPITDTDHRHPPPRNPTMRTIPYVLVCLTAAALVVGCSDDGSSDADSIEVQTDDGRLEVEIRLDDTDASAGSYDLPDGGSFAFDANGALTLTDVSPGEGWTVTEREQESDELEIDLRNEDRRVDVEVELDDGRIEVELDYEVVGPLPA